MKVVPTTFIFRVATQRDGSLTFDPKKLETQFKSKPETVRAFLVIITQQVTQILQLRLLILLTQNQKLCIHN